MLLLEAQIKLPRFLAARPRLSKKNMYIIWTIHYQLYYDTVSMTMMGYFTDTKMDKYGLIWTKIK